MVDDHNLVRESLARLLNAEEEFEVVGEASNGFEAVSMAQELKPDIVLIDIYLPSLDGISATRLIKREVPSTEIVALSASIDEEDIVEVMQAGARGYIPKTADSQTFLSELREVLSGGLAISPDITSKLVSGLSVRGHPTHAGGPETAASLTPREREVLELVARGFTNKEIAAKLSMSENTARAHVRSLMQKLNVDNRTRLAVQGTREGLGESGRRGAQQPRRSA